MINLILREPKLEDKNIFLSVMNESINLHHPWIRPPLDHDEFMLYLKRVSQDTHKSYLAFDSNQNITGVFNISEIVRGHFHSAYLGFYGIIGFTGQGYMSQGLKLVLSKIFYDLKLHRIEANIQPNNNRSLNLVKSNGFRREGYSPKYLKIDGSWRDHERWAMIYEDFVKLPFAKVSLPNNFGK
ncbi:MAG: GNAT family N-acetyltransferase [Alphaproteobacteria bacterium]|nr:GNAT family N-acetyltransferase [Alphaproteobacteria bacterium]